MNHSGLRIGCRHGLSDEEKKNTGDNFEMHIELAVLETLQQYLYVFFFPERRSLCPSRVNY